VCHSVLQCVTVPLQAQSDMAVGGKLTFYFPGKICFIFLISKCRGESDLGLCMSSGLAKRT